jgi:hypothetical protein
MIVLPWVFGIICLVLAFLNQRQSLKVMKARDRSDLALGILLSAAVKLPEVSSSSDWKRALKLAAEARRYTFEQHAEEWHSDV